MEDEIYFREYDGPRTLAALSPFPFGEFVALSKAVRTQEYSVGTNTIFLGIAIPWLFAKDWRRRQLLLSASLCLWALGLLYFAVNRHDWWLLLGIPLAWTGLVHAHLDTVRVVLRIGTILCLVGVCIAFFMCLAAQYWTALIPLSFSLFHLLKRLAIRKMKTRLRLRALSHERWFCMLYFMRVISLKRNETGETYMAEPFELRSDSQMP